MRAQTSTPMRWKRPDADYVPELMIQPEVRHPLHAHLGECLDGCGTRWADKEPHKH